LGARMPLADPARRLDAVHARHAQVEQRHVRIVLRDEGAGPGAVGRRAGDLDPGHEAEQRHEPLTDDGLIICDHHAHDAVAHAGTVARTVKNPSSRAAVTSPPTSAARSAIPVRPWPCAVAAAEAGTVLRTVRTASSPTASRSSTGLP